MDQKFARSVAKIAIAQLCDKSKFDSIQLSSLNTLVDMLIRYIEEIGALSHMYTEHANRTESNLHDVLMAFNDLGISVKELRNFVDVVDEVPFVHTLPKPQDPGSTRLEIPTFRQLGETPPQDCIPDWLPAFPDVHTTKGDGNWPEQKLSPRSEHLELDRERRKTESSLVALHRRMDLVTGGVGPSEEVFAMDTSRRGRRGFLWGQFHSESTMPERNMYLNSSKVTVVKAEDSGNLQGIENPQEVIGTKKGEELSNIVMNSFSGLVVKNKKDKPKSNLGTWTECPTPEVTVPSDPLGISFVIGQKGGNKVRQFFATGATSVKSLTAKSGVKKKTLVIKGAQERDEKRQRCKHILAQGDTVLIEDDQPEKT